MVAYSKNIYFKCRHVLCRNILVQNCSVHGYNIFMDIIHTPF